jgi:hypothetical protein
MVQVYVTGTSDWSTGVIETENPYQLQREFAFQHELEDKLVMWLREGKFKANSDYTDAWLAAWQFAANPLFADDFDGWCRYITGRK